MLYKKLPALGFEATAPAISYLAAEPQEGNPPKSAVPAPVVPLKDAFQKAFRVGVAVNRSVTMGQRFEVRRSRRARRCASKAALQSCCR